MSWRGLVALVALLATGIVSGFAAAAYHERPVATGVPQPVAAQDPSVPIDPFLLRKDPDEPELSTDLAMQEVSVGADPNRFCFPAPVGWDRIDPSSNEVKYKVKNNPENTFVLRVEQVTSQHEQIPDMVQQSVDDLQQDEQQVRIPVGQRTYDSLVGFSYVHDGYRRFGFRTWKDVTESGQAEAEIAVTGREVDLPGMKKLMASVVAGIRAC